MKKQTKVFIISLFILAVSYLILNQVQAMTDKYRLTLRGDPSTTIVIGWNQVPGSSNPVVRYDTIDHGTNWDAYPPINPDKVEYRSVSYKGMDNRFARLTELLPDKVYYFVIKDSNSTSNRYSFRTAPNDPSKMLSLIAGGDSRHAFPTENGIQLGNTHTYRRNANILVKKLRPHVVLFNGDMTRDNTDGEWNEWFNDWQLTIGDGRMIPIVVARGDHETPNATLSNLFDVPSNEVYYALPFGGNLLRVYTLNTVISNPVPVAETNWLKTDLISNSNTIWKIAQYHAPIRPHNSDKTPRVDLYDNWAPLFYNYGVRLVEEADSHVVKRTWPIRPYNGVGNDAGFIREDDCGTVYLGEGGWGAPLRAANVNYLWTRASCCLNANDTFNQFDWIFVDQNKIEVRTIKYDNVAQVGQVDDNDPFTPPANLDIWNPPNGTGSVVTIPRSAISRISSGNDDVEEDQHGVMNLNSGDLELVYDSDNNINGLPRGNQTIGLIFRNLHIPQGATITNAYIQFTVEGSPPSETCNLTIRGEDVDNPNDFSLTNKVSTRTRTDAFVPWAPPAWNTIGEAGDNQRTPDIKNIIQELVDRPGWTTGSALDIIITGTGVRSAESYEGSSKDAPVVCVEYTVPKGNLIACWKLDEGGGPTAFDSADDYDGTLNGASWTTEGRCDGGLCFDGINDSVSIPLAAATDAASDNIYTLSAWVNVLSRFSPQIIVSATDANGGGDARTIMEFSIYNGNFRFIPRGFREIIAPCTLGLHHLVGVRDGSTARFYVDGVLKGTVPGLSATPLTPLSFNFGKPHQNIYYFYGCLDEVCIYTDAKTDQEVQDLYNNPCPSPTPTESPTPTPTDLKAHWKLDEGSGPTAFDSADDYDGTLKPNPPFDGPTWTTGICDGALQFDGYNDSVSIPLAAATDAASDNIYTLSAWVSVENTTSPQIIVSATDANGGGDAKTIMEFSIYNGNFRFIPRGYTAINTPCTIGLHHLVGVRDGSTARFYVDGVLKGTVSGLSATPLTPLSFNLGKPHQNIYYFKGIIDEVRIYTDAKTGQEVLDLYNNPCP